MPTSEAARHDLYNGLTELLGLDRADTLMAYLPEFDPDDVATKGDIAELRAATKTDIAELRTATKTDIAELRTATKTDMARMDGNLGDLKSGQALLHSRIDRLFVTLVAGLFVIVAAMAGVVFTAL